MKKLEDKDWKEALQMFAELKPLFEADFAPCRSDDQYHFTVAAAERNLEDTVKQFKSDDDGMAQLQRLAYAKQDELVKDLADAEAKYDDQDYFGAGQSMGEMIRAVSYPWFIPFDAMPPLPPQQFLN